MSNIEILIQTIESAEQQARDLTRKDYTDDDVRDIVIGVGWAVEVFLKLSAFPERSSRRTFEQFINDLSTVGVSQIDVDTFHELRSLYNQAKHEPSAVIRLTNVCSLIGRFKQVLLIVKTLNFGRISEQAPIKYNRVFWLFAWDHFTGGDTEISIMVPSKNDEIPPALDDIYINALKWENLILELAQVGAFQIGADLFPTRVYEFFSNEGDFLAGGIFEGAYNNLLTTLAKYELRQQLLPGLNRHDSPLSMLQSTVLAIVECAPTFESEPLTEMLVSNTIDLCVNKYAVPKDYPQLLSIVESLAKTVKQVDFVLWKIINSPIWVDAESFQVAQHDALAVNTDYGVLLDKNCVAQLSIS